MEIIVGTAGHIDHGKTALIRALTGTDADRLPEEKERGITIDIGFAELTIGNAHFGFVDVPGHERFIKNMLAGATGIGLVLLVIAADEGVMPQTREHFEICRLLGIQDGIVVLTKSDMVDEETLDLARLDAAELVAGSFLENAPVVAVSSHTGDGIDELRSELEKIADLATGESRRRTVFLPIDRSFSVKGFGAVVTGTLSGGPISESDELELLPAGKRVRVRGVQTHGRSVPEATPGQRAAINLGGVDHSEIARGMALSEPGVMRPTQVIDTEFELLADAPKDLRSRQRVRLHLGTSEILARVNLLNRETRIVPGNSALIQFRLESPIACFSGQCFIVRSYSPQRTIGGGRVLAPFGARISRRKAATRLQQLKMIAAAREVTELVELFVGMSGTSGETADSLRSITGETADSITGAAELLVNSASIVNANGRYVEATVFNELRDAAIKAVAEYHRREPLSPGMPRAALGHTVFAGAQNELFTAVVASLQSDGELVAAREVFRLASFSTGLSEPDKGFADRLRAIFNRAGNEPPRLDEALAAAAAETGHSQGNARKLLDMLVRSGELVRVTDEFYFSGEALESLRAAVRNFADGSDDRVIDVPIFKGIAGVSRKYAIPLLEYFDREKVTVRAGDKRVVLK